MTSGLARSSLGVGTSGLTRPTSPSKLHQLGHLLQGWPYSSLVSVAIASIPSLVPSLGFHRTHIKLLNPRVCSTNFENVRFDSDNSSLIPDEAPGSSYEGRRAHPSLPQPLHLRFTFVDQQKRTASLRFEQVCCFECRRDSGGGGGGGGGTCIILVRFPVGLAKSIIGILNGN